MTGPVRTLDWSSRHDDRSRLYAAGAVLDPSVPLQRVLHPVGRVSPEPLDQGAEGACVGFAVATWTNVDVTRGSRLGDADALELYRRAQELDDVPGAAYSGTSVLAGMKAGVEAGHFDGYRWAFGTRELAQALVQLGPVVIGIPWTESMYSTAPNGLVTVAGATVGGHCLTLTGFDPAHPLVGGPAFTWLNSWGDDYGLCGLGVIDAVTLRWLLADRGEAAIPLPAVQVPA